MKPDTSQPIDKVTPPSTPQSADMQQIIANQQMANRDAMGQVGQVSQDLSFLTFLAPLNLNNIPLLQATITNDNSQTKAVVDDSKSNESTKEKKKPEQNNNNAIADSKSSSASVSSSNDDKKKVEDALSMLSVDMKQLTPMDLRALQNLSQVAALPWQNFNNMSSSLLEQLPQTYYKSLSISKGLQDMLDSAYKTQRPIRVDLSDEASVILRLSKDGHVSAEFLPNNQAADLFFQQHLQELRNRLVSKQLPFGELRVRQWNGQRNKQKR